MELVTVEFDASQFPQWLPHWADAKLDGDWVVNAQLPTKDGRKMGNAIILSTEEVVWDDKPVTLYTILTDFGTQCRLTVSELNWFFHPPQWRMIAERVQRRMAYIEGYID